MKRYRDKVGLSPLAGATHPREQQIGDLLKRTGYNLHITKGQRKYAAAIPEHSEEGTGNRTESSCEVFVGKIPRDCFEDELIPLFESCGRIKEFRLMVDPGTGLNKGFAFCTYGNTTSAQEALKTIDNKEIRPGRRLAVCRSIANTRLFVGSIPKRKSKEEILKEFSRVTPELKDAIVYLSDDSKLNRGFVFLVYESHQAAALALSLLKGGRVKIWGHVLNSVSWAEPQKEPDSDAMQKVKSIYVRNIAPGTCENHLRALFSKYGSIQKIRNLRDCAFIYFTERKSALTAIEQLNGKEINGLKTEVSLAWPTTSSTDKYMGAINKSCDSQEYGRISGDLQGTMCRGVVVCHTAPYLQKHILHKMHIANTNDRRFLALTSGMPLFARKREINMDSYLFPRCPDHKKSRKSVYPSSPARL